MMGGAAMGFVGIRVGLGAGGPIFGDVMEERGRLQR